MTKKEMTQMALNYGKYGLYDFHLTPEQEEKALAVYEDSYVIDMLFQGPLSPYSLEESFSRKIEEKYEPLKTTDPDRYRGKIAGAVLQAALDGLARVSDPASSSTPGVFASFFGPDPLNLLGVVLLTSLGTWGLPQMVHKFYTIKNEKSIHAGTIISTLFALVIAGGSYFMGAFGRLYYTVPEGGKPVFDNIVPQMLASSLPDLLIGVVMILVLSASMSTLSSLVITSSSTFTLDFLKGVFMKDMTHKVQLRWIRLLCIFFVALSVVLALNPNNLITSLMSLSWGALAGAFLAPFLYGLYWKKATSAACWASFLFSTVVMLSNIFVGSRFPALLQSPINAGAFCMLAGLVIVPVVSLFTRKPDPVLVEDAFSCYNKPVIVAQREALGD